MSLEDFIITVYCLVDETCKRLLRGQKLRQRGFPPGLSDSEVITMEIVAEYRGIDTDKGAWKYFCPHWRALFPRLGSRANFAKQAAYLWEIKRRIHRELAGNMGALEDTLHMVDGFPMPVCELKRAHFSRIFKTEADYGYCASKDKKYYGFKGNVMINSAGIITDINVTAASIDEREALWDMTSGVKGDLLADKGLIGAEYKQNLLEETGIHLHTPLRDNMKDERSPAYVKWLISTRRLVETVIGQLADRFHIEKIRARKTWYLTNRVIRKVLSHIVCAVINKQRDNPVLQFDRLVTA